jgi:hypothetical protein
MIEGLMTQDAILHVNHEVTSEDAGRIRFTFSQIEGIDTFQSEGETVTVVFYPEIISLTKICESLRNLGYELIQENKQRNPFKRLLGSLAESNQKTFGSERLDCCTINRKFKRH